MSDFMNFLERDTVSKLEVARQAGVTVAESNGMWRIYERGKLVASCSIREDAARVAFALAQYDLAIQLESARRGRA